MRREAPLGRVGARAVAEAAAALGSVRSEAAGKGAAEEEEAAARSPAPRGGRASAGC